MTLRRLRFSRDLLAHDLKTRTSQTFTLGYTPARHTAAVVNGGKIYVIGGRPARGTLPTDAVRVFGLTAKGR